MPIDKPIPESDQDLQYLTANFIQYCKQVNEIIGSFQSVYLKALDEKNIVSWKKAKQKFSQVINERDALFQALQEINETTLKQKTLLYMIHSLSQSTENFLQTFEISPLAHTLKASQYNSEIKNLRTQITNTKKDMQYLQNLANTYISLTVHDHEIQDSTLQKIRSYLDTLEKLPEDIKEFYQSLETSMQQATQGTKIRGANNSNPLSNLSSQYLN